MKKFVCGSCGNDIYFENTTCLRCNSAIGFNPATMTMITLQPAGDATYIGVGGKVEKFKYCSNSTHGACNWLTSIADGKGMCAACDLNRTIPNLDEPGNLDAWRQLEFAKKRLVYSLLSFGLPLHVEGAEPRRLTFDFLRKATTGHKDGVITVDITEADSVERERQRLRFEEPYRTLLGHLRHESGHFYWQVLVEDSNALAAFRSVFGDERQDYGQALARHYQQGPRSDWQTSFVSAYASAHPWEDWAETWAQYLHIVDTVDMAESVGLEPRATGLIFGARWPFKRYDIYRQGTIESLMERWIPLALGLNNLSRSMGHADFYPFIIPVGAREKLDFIHSVIRRRQQKSR
jgi:hypothetical protein